MIADPSRKTPDEFEARMLEQNCRLIEHLISVDEIVEDIKSGDAAQDRFKKLKLPLTGEQRREILDAIISEEVLVDRFLKIMAGLDETEAIVFLMLLVKEHMERRNHHE
jgi:hypothetical protein